MSSLISLFTLITLLFHFTAHAQSFDQFELLARASQNDSFGLSAPSYLANTELEINDAGLVSFTYTGYDAQTSAFHQRVASITSEGQYRLRYQAPEGYFLTRPSQNALGEILVYQHREGLNDGLWKISQDDLVEQILSPRDFPQVQGYTAAQINDRRQIFWREFDSDGARSFVWFDLEQRQAQTIINDHDQIHSYLFTPVMRDQWLASKVRFGTQGQWAENQPDQIILWNQEKQGQMVVARDRDDDLHSPYISFHNSLGLNSKGDVVFVASGLTGKKSVVLFSKGRHQTIATEGIELQEIETFAPVLNEAKKIAFRAKDLQGDRSIFTWSESGGLVKIISEGDYLATDVETGRVLKSSWGPGFSGQIALNNQDVLVFTVVLESKDGSKRLGTAIYRIKI